MNTSSLRSAIPSSSSHDLPADCSNPGLRNHAAGAAHIVALAAQHASGSVEFIPPDGGFFISLARMQCADCGDQVYETTPLE